MSTLSTERFGHNFGAQPMSQDQAQTAPLARAPAREPGALAPMREPGQIALIDRDSAEPPASGAPPSAPGRARSPRRFVLPLVALAALGYGVYWGYNWFVEGRFLVSTDDAYVGADASVIAAKVAGHVVEVPIAENQKVHAGDLLARIDDGDYRLAVEAAKAKIATQDATIARIGRQVEAQNAAIDQAAAQVASADAQAEGAVADEKRAALELDRSQKLADVAFGSQQRLEQATADRARAAATLAAALASKTAALAALAGAKDAAEVLKAEQTEAERVRGELVTAEAKAERDLSFTEIRAPFDGVVGNKAAVVGQYAMPGTRLLAVVPVQAAYVDANFKETQLDAIRPGEKVDVAVDSFDGRVVPGVVESVSPASGAQFSLLPPDNATGNFTKVVQRVTVRIAIAPEALAREALRAGLSVVATIHTRDESQPRPTLLGLFGLGASAGETGGAK
jgi:membrane fusion protein (multidrug efflux system)